MPIEAQLLSEARRYEAKRPRRVISANCENYPSLRWLYHRALLILTKRPQAKLFTYEGVRYAIVWQGGRMCVMHMPTHRLLVGAPGTSDE
jgi:hypothetical protein